MFNHIGIPTAGSFDGEIPLPHLKMTVSDHQSNPFGIQWQRYWDDAPYPDLVKTVPHVAFEVDDLAAALEGQHVIIEPNSPSRGVLVAFIEGQRGSGRAHADRPRGAPGPVAVGERSDGNRVNRARTVDIHEIRAASGGGRGGPYDESHARDSRIPP
jgi:hypothetical protein